MDYLHQKSTEVSRGPLKNIVKWFFFGGERGKNIIEILVTCKTYNQNALDCYCNFG